VEFVAELGICCTLHLEFDLPWCHPLVAPSAIAGYGEGGLVIMAGAAGLPLFHLGHGDLLFLAGYHLAVVAALALSAGLGYVDLMTECRFSRSLLPICYASRLTLVATNAILFRGDAERLDAGMAGPAGLGLFHLRHCVMSGLFYVEYGIVANPAVVVIFGKMDVMAEDHRLGVFELEQDVFGFRCV